MVKGYSGYLVQGDLNFINLLTAKKGHRPVSFFCRMEAVKIWMGRKEPGFPSNWDEISYGIMKKILTAKFSVPELSEKLKATGDAVLIEGNNHHDNKWGNCLCERCKNKEGQNWLGKILMEVRDTL